MASADNSAYSYNSETFNQVSEFSRNFTVVQNKHTHKLILRYHVKNVNLIEFEMELGFRKRVQIFV